MSEKPNIIPGDLLEAVKRFDIALSNGKKPYLSWDAVNLPEGDRVQYSDDDTRQQNNPYDDILDAMNG
jgi:hypothetical protein